MTEIKHNCTVCGTEREHIQGKVKVIDYDTKEERIEEIDMGWHCMKCSEAGKDGECN